MGRTYEALSKSRTQQNPVNDEEIPPTAVIPLFQTEREGVSSEHDDLPEEIDQATADTALDDLSKDNDNIPFVEIGGPKGTTPVYGHAVDQTPVPNPSPLRLIPRQPAPAEPSDGAPSWLATFFPLPTKEDADAKRVAADLIAFVRPEHPASANYRSILAGIEAQHTKTSCPLMVFTSVGYATEAVSAILNLAITRAREESRRVLVIEANYERPLIASRLGVGSMPGMREILNGSLPIAVALHATPQANLFVLPPGDADLPVSTESEARLPSVLQHLRQRFDWIVVNSPEWDCGGAADWAALGDSVYLVVPADQWNSAAVESAYDGLVKSGGKLKGYITLRQQ